MTSRHTRAAIVAACRNIARAAHYERRLAEIETRALEPRALDASDGGSTP
jgi:hypothetical protein